MRLFTLNKGSNEPVYPILKRLISFSVSWVQRLKGAWYTQEGIDLYCHTEETWWIEMAKNSSLDLMQCYYMCAIDMSTICARRCKCTGLRAPRPNLSSKARSIRWTLFFSTWQWSSKHYSDQFLPDNDQNDCKIILMTSSPTGFLHCKADS